MKHKLTVYLVLILMALPVTIRSQLPFLEDFGDGTEPAGWSFPSNWQVGSVGYAGHPIGNPSPAAFFYWNPAVTNYSERMTGTRQEKPTRKTHASGHSWTNTTPLRS